MKIITRILTWQSFEELINKLSSNKKVKIGPQSSRKGSEPKNEFMIKKNDIIFSNLYGFKSPLIEEASKKEETGKILRKYLKRPVLTLLMKSSNQAIEGVAVLGFQQV